MPNLHAIRSLLKLCELPELELSAQHAQSLSQTSALARIGALQILPVPDSIWVPYRDDEVEVDLEPHPDPERFRRYKCPETGRWITVSEPDVHSYAVDLIWLAGFVGRSITPAFELSGQPLIPGILMRLGPHRIGEPLIDVLLCRRFDHHCAAIGGVLQAGRFRQPTLILTTGSPTLRVASSAGHCVTLSLADCFIQDGGSVHLDQGYLAKAVSIPREAMVSADEVYFNPASGELRLPGKPVTHFNGDQQIAVIDRLYKAWMQKLPNVKAAELLKAAKTETPSLPQLFSGCHDWKTYIANPKRGWYRLNV